MSALENKKASRQQVAAGRSPYIIERLRVRKVSLN
jgi:hypothetical protein